MSTLADLIRDAAVVDGKPMSNRTIASLTNIAPETINRIMRGEGNPDVGTVDKIADALRLPRQVAREAADLPRGEQGVYEPPAESRLLDARQRSALDELIRSFVSSPRITSAEASVTDIATKRVDNRDEIPPPVDAAAARKLKPGENFARPEQGDAGGDESQIDPQD